ncbi:ATP-binding protein [Streptomyces sp. WAC 01529]|uniref:ATP-binding protein n=1 Tax=Streptomyces sp. WAC 01529 TaxID=2203205 RepID=UPI000F6DA193|nr:AAA family ATPase [Streptomyces sp. WAC 01529]AZM53646.1 ATP-binding protein [Streptomyces sp. WAC 01529]
MGRARAGAVVIVGPGEDGGAQDLLGRGEFLRAMRAQLERARGGRGGLLLVSGEAGIGKTALTGCAVHEARRAGMAVLRGSCWGADGTPGYWPWTQVIRGLRGSLRAEAWEAASEAAGTAWQVLLDGGGRAEESGRFELFDAVTTMLVTAAQHQPVLVVLEDVHWADSASVALLEFAAQHVSLERVLIVATCRLVEVERPDHSLRDRLRSLTARATTLTLTGLGADDVAELMHRTAGTAPDGRLVADVLHRTGGNPFFVQETARLWAGGHEVSGMSPGLHASLRQRLHLLDGAVADCLGAASVLGRRFRADTLASVMGAPPGEVCRWLDQAAGARLVAYEPDGEASQDWLSRDSLSQKAVSREVVFEHDLVRETLYGSLDTRRVRRLHAAAVRALRSTTDARDVTLPVELARHAHLAFEELDRDEAVDLLLSAARHAENRMAHEEAAGHYQRALDRLGDAAPARRVLLILHFGTALQMLGEHERSWREYADAATLARGLNDPLLMGWTALTLYGSDGRGDTALLKPRVLRWAHEQQRAASGEPATAGDDGEPTLSQCSLARHVAAGVIAGARAAGDDDTLHIGLWARLQSEWGPRTVGDRRALAEELVAVSRRRGDRWTEHVAMSMSWVAALEAGDPRFMEDFHAMVALGAADGSARLRLHSVIDRSIIDALTGRFTEATELLEASESMSASSANYYQYFVSHHRWSLLVLRGRFTEARRLLDTLRAQQHPYVDLVEALADLEAGEGRGVPVPRPGAGAGGDTVLHRSVTPLWLRYQAQAAAASGDPAWCDNAHAALVPYTGQWLVSLFGWDISGPAALWLGVLDAARQRWDSAVRHLTEACRSADRLHALPWSLRSRLELTAAIAAQGAHDERYVARLLGEAEPQARELGMTHLLARVEHLGGGRPDRVDAPAAYEFRRNGEVWRLTYEGRTVHMPDAKGLRDLHCLLSLPGQDIAAVRLLNPDDDTVATAHGMGADDVLDDEARTRYRRHLERLEEEIDRAVEQGDERRAAAYDQERADLLEELRRYAGLGGRPRRLGDSRERARKNVTGRIRDTLRKLDQRHPDLAAHLRRALSTGTMCRYTPDRELRWKL